VGGRIVRREGTVFSWFSFSERDRGGAGSGREVGPIGGSADVGRRAAGRGRRELEKKQSIIRGK